MKLFGVRSRRRSAGLTVVDARLTIRGDMDTDGTVRVDGRVEGLAHRVGTLVVGPNGTVVGDVDAAEVIVAGSVTGNVHATGRIEIEPGAAVRGDVQAAALVMREGAAINGQVLIESAPEAPAAVTTERYEIAHVSLQSSQLPA
jgi:cytoskeletal protein CcmA (bactofilin family)